MATISLKDGAGQTIATIPDDTPVVDTGQEQEVGGENSHLVQTVPANPENPETPAVTGYVPESYLNELNVREVTIPQNFAGMEAIAVPTRLRPQLFDIVEVVENEDCVEITALHMFYRLAENMTLWKPTAGINYTGAAACRNVLTNQLSTTKFLVASDCRDEKPGDEMDYERRNIVETFLDPESGICAKYGLSLIRDNDVFYCLKEVGYDRGFLIENGKNLLGVERRVNIENTVTRVAPVGRDTEGEYVWLNRNGKKYVDSEHINDYPWPRAEIYYTDLTIGENGVTAENIQQKLYEEALTRFSIDEADVPEVTMTIQFVSLGDTEEYKQYRNLDKVYLYDILTIHDTVRGYDYAAQVVGVEHNILTGMLESVTIGHLTETDGTRKVATWKVPEVNGHKVRQKTIRSGALADSSVTSNKIANNAVESQHLGQSADGHFKQIFAEELYISNTSEDGLLNTRFSVTEGRIEGVITKTGINSLGQNETLYSKLTQTADAITAEVSRASDAEGELSSRLSVTADAITAEVTRATTAEGTISGNLSVEAGKISQIVTAVGADGEVTAGSIVLAINQSTGEAEAKIDAGHVYIGNEQSTTVINGKLNANDLTATRINALYTSGGYQFTAGSAYVSNLQVTTNMQSTNVQTSGLSVGGSSYFYDVCIAGSQDATTGIVTLKFANGGDFSFSRAATPTQVTLSGGWSGRTFTVSASPSSAATPSIMQGRVYDTIVPSGTTTYDSTTKNVSKTFIVYADDGSGSAGSTILSRTLSISADDAYDDGANSVTLSQGSWSNGTKVVTASNGATANVYIPSTESTNWVNTSGNVWRADLTIGGVERRSATKDFQSVYDDGAASVTLSQGSWSEGTKVVTASNGETINVNIPSTSNSDWTWVNTSANIWRADVVIGGATRRSVTKDFQSVYDDGAASVTMSQGSWSEGSKVVTATNGQTLTVNIPSTSSSEWENTSGRIWRANLTVGGAIRRSSTKDFQSVYDDGWNAARAGVASPAAGNSNTMHCSWPSATVDGDPVERDYVLSVDNTYAYVKYNGTNRARVSNPAYGNGWRAARADCTIPASGNTDTMTCEWPSSSVDGTKVTREYELSIDESYAYVKYNGTNRARVANTPYANVNVPAAYLTEYETPTYVSSTKSYSVHIEAKCTNGNTRRKNFVVNGTAAYNQGYNDALTACGLPANSSSGTVYTGTWRGTLYVAPTGGATPVNNCVGDATAHTVTRKS